VKWAGFTDLSSDADEAAQQSRTIRYQRELVQRRVRERRGELVDELVFLEISPDRGTPHVMDGLAQARRHCVEGHATLLWVNFAQSNRWRPHQHLHHCLYEMGMRNEPLDPIEWPIDGEPFNPTRHFRDWQRLDDLSQAQRQEAIPRMLAAAMDRVPAGYGRNGEIAEYLNQSGARTKTGVMWTADTVGKAIKALVDAPGNGGGDT
jgi:hypothetical protein